MAWVLVLLAAAALAACGRGDEPLDEACLESPRAIERALARAPAPVTLAGGTRLSECVANARSDSDLQNAGTVLTRAADDLAEAARAGDALAALRLGYLVGATRKGAKRTAGIHAELQRRIERAAAHLDEAGARVAAAVARGVRAGEATG
jgi:integrase